MRRPFRFLTLVLTVLCFGATTALAQSVPSNESLDSESSPAIASDEDETTSVVVDRSPSASLASRQDVVDAMMQNETEFGSDNRFAATPPPSSFDLASDASSRASMQAEDGNNRRLYYIIGGVLVAGGLAAGILALSGDDGDVGIPPPPGRPQ